MSGALKPCPFCGSDAELIVDLIQCAKCGAVGPYGKAQIRGAGPALADWNRRAPHPATAELGRVAEEMRRAYEIAANDMLADWAARIEAAIKEGQ